jgi:hypothetical protein
MSVVLGFLHKWNSWFRVLRHDIRFNLLDSVCYGFWLARAQNAFIHLHSFEGKSSFSSWLTRVADHR